MSVGLILKEMPERCVECPVLSKVIDRGKDMEHEFELWDLNRNVQQILKRLESIETMLKKESMGHWETKWSSARGTTDFQCSKCGALEPRMYPVCPVCEAKMLGVK